MKEYVVAYEDLLERCSTKFKEIGVSEEDANLVADVLVHANLRGVDSHGVLRTEHYINKIKAGGLNIQPQIKQYTTGLVTGIVDGDDCLGHIAANQAMDFAIELAQEHGVGIVGAINSSHCGALSYFVNKAAEADMIGIVMSNTDKGVVPFGGKEMFFGTNPMAFGFPAHQHSNVILDMATSSVAYGKVLDYREKNMEIPNDWAVDEKGNFVTDPHKVKAMVHFGGAKGYGLALVVDVLSSILMGAAFGPNVVKMYSDDLSQKRKLAQFFCVIDPDKFTSLQQFKLQMDALIDELHAIPPKNGIAQVLVPGELELQRQEQRLIHGIPLSEVCYNYLFN